MSKATVFGLVVGPGEAPMAIDTLESIFNFYPAAACCVRDDATQDGTFETLFAWARGKNVWLSRNDRSFGFLGLPHSIGHLFLDASGLAPDVLIKVDPDTLMLGAGIDEVIRDKFRAHGNGLCGSYRVSPEGHPRSFTRNAINMLIDQLPIGPDTKWTHVRAGRVCYSRFLPRALKAGYSLGEHAQGGLYGISGPTVGELVKSGYLKALTTGRLGRVRQEDSLIALGVRAVGHPICSINDFPGRVTAFIKAARPLPLTRDQIRSGGFLAIHPVKKQDEDVRSYFRELRNGLPTGSIAHD
jgi:hypothetical protein